MIISTRRRAARVRLFLAKGAACGRIERLLRIGRGGGRGGLPAYQTDIRIESATVDQPEQHGPRACRARHDGYNAHELAVRVGLLPDVIDTNPWRAQFTAHQLLYIVATSGLAKCGDAISLRREDGIECNVTFALPALSTSFAMGRAAFMAIPSKWFMAEG
jgi:hypothetical protein